MHILIVEDSSFQRRNLQNILISARYTVSEAEDGNAALAYLENATDQQPDVILLDLLMPGMDGFELLGILAEKYATIPTIVVTSDIQVTSKQQCTAKGARDVINKPVKAPQLLKAIKKILDSVEEQPIHELGNAQS